MIKFLLILLGSLMVFTASAVDFEYEYEGQTLTYTIISEEDHTVMTKAGEFTSAGNSVSGDLIIPSVVVYNEVKYSVTAIGNYAFISCGLTSVTIPESVTSIGEFAFSSCKGLTSVTIPESVTVIGNFAFSHCTGLTSVTIPESVTSIGGGAFTGCSGLTSVTIPESVTVIEEQTFNGCSGLTSVTIPESVTSIGYYAFADCTGLTKAEFASIEALCSIEFVNSHANPLLYAHHLYINGNEVTKVDIPESVTSIGKNAFNGCTSLTSVTIPQSVTSIGEWAFTDCFGLTKAEFASIEALCSIEFGDYYANPLYFAPLYINGNEVTKVDIPESVTSIGKNAFYGYTGLTSVTIPESVTSIGQSAFFHCTGLTSVTIPQSVTAIEELAFYDCSGLTSVTIPESVTTISNNAFSFCFSLRMMDLSQAKISDFAGILSNIAEKALIFVPEGTVVTEGRANVVVGNQCENLVINYGETANDQLLFKVPHEFTANNVTINRSFTQDQPYTLYLPFAMNAADYGTFYTGGKFNQDDNMVYFTRITEEKATPNTPYMFQPKQDYSAGITIESPVAVAVTPEDTEADGLNGVYEKKEFTADETAQQIYYGWADGVFCWAEEGAKVDACRAYFRLPASAAAKAPARLKVKLGEDGTTGISDIDREDGDTESPAYNINGQRVTDGYRGIVIKNGRKTANLAR